MSFDSERWPMISPDGDLVHGTRHLADWMILRPRPGEATSAWMARIRRHQLERDAHEFGYRVLGESG